MSYECSQTGSGRKIVLVATRAESCEFNWDPWIQMLFATVPEKYAKLLIGDNLRDNEREPDGQAKYVPNGLRVVEALLLRDFRAEDIAVCYPSELGCFVGEDTRVVGVHAHNPMGITFAADVYAQLAGPRTECVNAKEFREMMSHPALARHRGHLRVIAGGPGTWQIKQTRAQRALGIDCLVEGEAEDLVLPLFHAAIEGEPLPVTIEGHSPKNIDGIPPTKGRSTLGVVEITRGCGRGCQFCSIAGRRGHSVPLEQVLENVRTNAAAGANNVLLTTEDMFLYQQGPKFATNVDALGRLFEAVTSVPGVDYLSLSHATMAPIVANPTAIERLSPIGVGRAYRHHPQSTHPEKRYQSLFIGLETGSVRLFKQFMKGKGYPFRPEQWPDVVLKGMEILNRWNWFPFCTFIIGLPGETDEDMKQTLDLLHALNSAKWCVVPTLFTPLEETRLGNREAAKLPRLTELQWEFFFTCWRHDLDFLRPNRTKLFSLGIPIYYYALGRKLFGNTMRYPLFRLAHFPESVLHRRLYLDLRAKPRIQVPDQLPAPLWAQPGAGQNLLQLGPN